MRVYISADIEGITGLVSWSQCGRPDGKHFDYPFAREMMTHDVNAAIRGARAAGATDIVVKDSHGNSKNLILKDLEPGVRLVSGHGASKVDGMMVGIDDSFDAAMLIGYHAMAGTLGGIMEHTVTGWVHRMWINGKPAGEIALSAGVAGSYGVPVVCVTSDKAGAAEAIDLVPALSTAVVKTGEGRYMGECLHPSEACGVIEKAAEMGCRAANEIKPWIPDAPVTVTVEANRAEQADYAARMLGVVRKDAYTVEWTGKTYREAHQVAWTIFAMGGVGTDSGE